MDPAYVPGMFGPPPVTEDRRPPPELRTYSGLPSPPPPLHATADPPPFDESDIDTSYEIENVHQNGVTKHAAYYPHVDDPELDGGKFHATLAPEYHNGWCIERTVNVSKNLVLKEKVSRSAIHPFHKGFEIPPNSNRWEYPEVPGQYRMCYGYSYAQVDSTDSSMRETVAWCVDEATLPTIPRGQEALDHMLSIRQLAFGTEANNWLDGIWTKSFLRNLRSSEPTNHSPSGSYSLGFVKLEVSNGIIAPALQSADPEARSIQSRILHHLGVVVAILLRIALQREELDDLEWCGKLWHITGFGSADNLYETSVQMNVSNIYELLAAAIGGLQGGIHVDNDKPSSWTVLLVFFRNGESDQPGGFILPQHFLYARFKLGDRLFAMVFKAISPHSALEGHPFERLSAEQVAKIIQGPPNRIVFVCYSKQQIAERVSPANIHAPQKYGSNYYTKYTTARIDDENGGRATFGGDRALQMSWCGGEGIFQRHNMAVQQGTTALYPPVLDQLAQARVYNNEKEIVPLKTHYINPYDFRDIVDHMMYHNFRERVCKRFNLHIGRIELKLVQKKQFGDSQPGTGPGIADGVVVPSTYKVQASQGAPVTQQSILSGGSAKAKRCRVEDEGDEAEEDTDSGVESEPEPERDDADFPPRKRQTRQSRAGAKEAVDPRTSQAKLGGPPASSSRKGTTKTAPLPNQGKSRSGRGGRTSAATQKQADSTESTMSSRSKTKNGITLPPAVNVSMNDATPSEGLVDDSPEEEEYPIDRAREINVVNGELVARVGFEGFGREHDLWYSVKSLDADNCRTVVTKMKSGLLLWNILPSVLEKIGGTGVVELQRPGSPPAAASRDTDGPPPNAPDDWVFEGEQPDPTNPTATLPDGYIPKEVDRLFEHLTSKLKVDDWQSEVDGLVLKFDNNIPTPLPSLTKLLKTLKDDYQWEREHMGDFYQISQKLSLVGNQTPSDGWSNKLGLTCITRVIRATNFIPEATFTMSVLDDIIRVLRLSIARGYILAWGLGTSYGPSFARHIFATIFPDSQPLTTYFVRPEEGYNPPSISAQTSALIASHFPSFEKAIICTLKFVRACVWAFKKKYANGEEGDHTSFSLGKKEALGDWKKLDERVGECGEVEYSVFAEMGITSKKTFRLPIRSFAANDADALRASLSASFVDLLLLGTTLPSLDAAEKRVPMCGVWIPSTEKKMRYHYQAERIGRATLRGAVYTRIADTIGEGFFVLDEAHRFVQGDSFLTTAFGTKSVLNAMGKVVNIHDPLTSYSYALEKMINANPEIPQLADAALETVLERFVLLGEPKKSPGSEFSASLNLTAEQRQARALACLSRLPPILPNLGSRAANLQLRFNDGVDVSILVLLVREALRAEAGANPVTSEGRNILEGKHPATGVVKWQSDHFQPARRLWKSTQLLKRVVPDSVLGSPLGLTSVLNFAAFGHGEPTQNFLSKLPIPCSLPLELAQYYMQAILANEVCYNLRVYGQPSRAFGYTLSEGPARLEAHYSIQPLYTAFIGEERIGTDPSAWEQPVATWREGNTLLKGLCLPAFKSGLNVFHTTNHLALRGILRPATLDDIVTFLVDEGHDKGALKHLWHCGLIVSSGKKGQKASYKAVSQALTLIYNHFDKHLTTSQKTRLGFNYDFIENMLCKATRWLRVGRSVHGEGGTKPTKQGLAVSIHNMAKAIPNSPIPLVIPPSDLKDYIVITGCN